MKYLICATSDRQLSTILRNETEKFENIEVRFVADSKSFPRYPNDPEITEGERIYCNAIVKYQRLLDMEGLYMAAKAEVKFQHLVQS